MYDNKNTREWSVQSNLHTLRAIRASRIDEIEGLRTIIRDEEREFNPFELNKFEELTIECDELNRLIFNLEDKEKNLGLTPPDAPHPMPDEPIRPY